MDSTTLDNLKTAFASAPSPELAKVIVFALIEQGATDNIAPFIAVMSTSIADDDLAALAKELGDINILRAITDISPTLEREILATLIKSLVTLENVDAAKSIYETAREKNPSARSAELDEMLGLEPKGTRLKVVEKPDVAEITDLSRYREEQANFKDVVGLEKIKKQIQKKIILPFQSPSLFARFKKKVGGGVLLYGPPGCGKTLLARATAGECNASFFNVEISDVLDMYIGESEQKLHAIFERARSETPSVLFFDELEALAGKREHARSSSSANTVSQFLTELDGFAQNNEGVLVLASTNVPWAIDSAFLRPGRFDRMFFVPPPDKVARQGILEHHIAGRPYKDNISFTALADKTPGYSGADLANLIEMAADEAIDESIEANSEVSISNDHFRLALKESRATTMEWLTTARNYARYANDGGRYNDVLDFISKHRKN